MDEGALPARVEGSSEPKIPEGDIYEAIRIADGNLSAATRALADQYPGTRRSYVKKRVEQSPLLSSLLEDMREEIVDTAEDNLFAEVRKGDSVAGRFVLQTIGRNRGYVQGVTGSGKDGEIVIQINKLAPESAS